MPGLTGPDGHIERASLEIEQAPARVVGSTAQAFRSTVAANVVIALTGTAAGIFSARLLGPSGKGQLAAIQLWPSLLGIVASLGLAEALVYFCASSPRTAGRQLGSAMCLGAVAAIILASAGYFALPTLLSGQSPGTVAGARLYLLLVPLFILTLLPFHPLRGQGAFTAWNVLRIAPGLAWLAVVSYCFLAHTGSAFALANSYLVILTLLSIPVLAVVRRRVRGPYRPSLAIGRSLLGYGLPAVTTTLPQVVNLRLDQLVMVAVVTPTQFGYYVAAVAWSSAASPALVAIGMVLFPSVASRPGVAEKGRIVCLASRMGLCASIVLTLIIALATPTGFTFLFSSRFRPAIPAALILVCAGAAYGYNYVMSEGIRGLGHPKKVLFAELGGAFATAISLLCLLKPWGIVGAAISSSIGYGVTMLLLFQFTRRLLGCSIADLTFKRADLARGKAIACSVACRLLPSRSSRGGKSC